MTYEVKITKTNHSTISTVDFNNIPFGQVFTDHILVCDYTNGEWGQPEIIPFGNLSLHPATSALHYGQTIFEGMKAYKTSDGRTVIFRPDRNFARFNHSADRMCMPNIPKEIFIDGLKSLIDLDKEWVPNIHGSSLYIRPFMFGTDGAVGVRPSDNYKFVIICSPVNSYYPEPIKVIFETHYSRAAFGGTGEAKNGGNYGAAMLPTKLVQDKGFKQVLWTDSKEHRYVEESGTMNVFFVIEDVILTPDLSGRILHGVTRESAIQLLKEAGFIVEERPIEVSEIVTALKEGKVSEAFGCGTAATIAHISHIGHDADVYELPPVEGRKYSTFITDNLDAIKTGKLPDIHHWLETI